VHTLEAIIAGLLLLTSVLFSLQMTAVTPLSASTSNQHIENQQAASVQGLLAGAAETGSLQRSLVYWNGSADRFHNTSLQGYYTDEMPTAFGQSLERSFGTRGIAYNVYVHDRDGTGPMRMIYHGEPSDNAVSVSRDVVLTDDARFRTHDMQRGDPLNESRFYAEDVGANGLYAVLRVEVVVWRI
jgi:hypothetical protein